MQNLVCFSFCNEHEDISGYGLRQWETTLDTVGGIASDFRATGIQHMKQLAHN